MPLDMKKIPDEKLSSKGTPTLCQSLNEVVKAVVVEAEGVVAVAFVAASVSEEEDASIRARVFTPGATMSGLRISRVSKLGPLDENSATIGDGLIPNLVFRKANVAVGFLFVNTYCLMFLPSFSPNAIAGIM
ncbi:unnamed protein product [Vicia faba]|uniref:Uncharacterized protein n=1 Tax=Vicia faba TaxID=3906 RepID=A0AAV1A0V0_VICFA|nr:unnamed protein product [Vicia faba]